MWKNDELNYPAGPKIDEFAKMKSTKFKFSIQSFDLFSFGVKQIL